MRVLGLDTDVQPTGSANVDENALLRHEEMLELPLRKPQDYRRDGAKFGTWLSRRWLFNIPRSQQTEGIRPLGRLALADHSERVSTAIKNSLNELMAAETQLNRNTSASGASAMPRVVLVGGIGGGTGGGMFVDLCYLIRQTLDDLKFHSGELIAVMTHATPRNPQAQDVAAATAYSTLSELGHYLRPGVGYVGDASCGLKPFTGKRHPFDAAYLVHLGNELTPALYERGVDRIGEFLFLESATPAGGYFAACRRNDEGADDSFTLRTIGLCQLGFSQDRLLSELTDEVCRETIRRWMGTPRPNVRNMGSISVSASSASASVLAQRGSIPQSPAKDEDLDQLAEQLASSLQIDQAKLAEHIRSMIEADVGQDSNNLVKTLATPDGAAGESKLLSRVDQLFGARDEQGELPEARQATVRQAMDSQMRDAVAPIGERLQKELEALLDSPLARVYGAARVVQKVQKALKTLAENLRSTRVRLNQELVQHAPWMQPIDARQRGKRTSAEIASLRLQYCQLRLEDVIAAGSQQMLAAIQSYAGQFNDLVIDLDRELKAWQDQFRDFDAAQFVATDSQEPSDELRQSGDFGPLDALRSAISNELQQRIPGLAATIDQSITASFLAQNGGLKGTVLVGGPLRQDLAKILHELARRGMSRLLHGIDIPSLLAENVTLTGGCSGQPNPMLTAALKSAEPPLTNCGGNRRLVSLIPNQHSTKWPLPRVHQWLAGQGFGHKPAALTNCGSDAVVLYEIGGISLRLAAGTFIDFRPDLADVARRLHTRTDINWAPLPLT
jgi:hypothetical protein